MSPRIFRKENERYCGHLTDSSLKMTVCDRSRRSYGKIRDCEQSKSSTFFPSLSHHSSNLCFFAVSLLIVFYALLISLKKKNLPAVILNLLYCGFRFLSDQRSLPVLWHQSLLTFVQRWVMLLNGQGQNSARQFGTLEIAYVAGTKRVGEGEKLENREKGINPPHFFPYSLSPTPFNSSCAGYFWNEIVQFRIKNYRWIQTLTANLYRVSLDIK